MNKVLTVIIVFSLLLGHSAFANKEVGNGGDICEYQFKTISDDLSSWIARQGSATLNLPQGVSVSTYDSQMSAAISKAVVSCVDDEIEVGGAEKTCKNFVDPEGKSQIVCNRARFMATSDSDRYVLVHHEYAGLSGFEINDGPDSQYVISRQISGYLTDQVVKKLAITPQGNSGGDLVNQIEWDYTATASDRGTTEWVRDFVATDHCEDSQTCIQERYSMEVKCKLTANEKMPLYVAALRSIGLTESDFTAKPTVQVKITNGHGSDYTYYGFTCRIGLQGADRIIFAVSRDRSVNQGDFDTKESAQAFCDSKTTEFMKIPGVFSVSQKIQSYSHWIIDTHYRCTIDTIQRMLVKP